MRMWCQAVEKALYLGRPPDTGPGHVIEINEH